MLEAPTLANNAIDVFIQQAFPSAHQVLGNRRGAGILTSNLDMFMVCNGK